VDDSHVEISFHLGSLEPARTGDMQSVLAAQLAKVGDAPFRLEIPGGAGTPAVLIPAATFKENPLRSCMAN